MNKNISPLFSTVVCSAMIVTVSGCLDSSKKESGQQKVESGGSPEELVVTILSEGPKALEDGSTVLVSVGGVPVVTEKSLDEFLETIAQENDQLRMLLRVMPAEIKKGALDAQISKEIVALGASKILERDPKALEKFRNRMEAAIDEYKSVFYVEAIKESLPDVTISDEEVRAFYDENKENNPQIMIQPGGVEAIGIQFDDQDSANEFYQAVMGSPTDFKAIASQQGLDDKVRKFENVSPQSFGVDSAVRDTLSGLTRFPSVQLIAVADNNIWVVAALAKHDPEYRSFEELQQEIRNGLTQQKQQEQLESTMNDLREEYNISVNESFMKQLDEQAGDANDLFEDQLAAAIAQGQGDMPESEDVLE